MSPYALLTAVRFHVFAFQCAISLSACGAWLIQSGLAWLERKLYISVSPEFFWLLWTFFRRFQTWLQSAVRSFGFQTTTTFFVKQWSWFITTPLGSRPRVWISCIQSSLTRSAPAADSYLPLKAICWLSANPIGFPAYKPNYVAEMVGSCLSSRNRFWKQIGFLASWVNPGSEGTANSCKVFFFKSSINMPLTPWGMFQNCIGNFTSE